MIRAVIIEDEINGLNNLKNLLSKYCEDVEVIAEAGSIEEGEAVFKNLEVRPDVAFLDIKLPDGLVFQLLDRLGTIDFEIIFVTAFEKFAIKACNYSSIGFILKPIDPDELTDAVSRIRAGKPNKVAGRYEHFTQVYNNNPNAFEKLSIAALDGTYFIHIKDIIRLEGEDNYTHIFLNSNEKITVSRTLKFYEDLLKPMNFYRVHKKHLINLNYMRKYVKGGSSYLIMDDDIHIEVSRRRRTSFTEYLRRLQEISQS